MADEKQNDEPAPDPWGDLLSGGSDEPASEFAFSFDEPDEAAPAVEPAEPDVPAAEPEPEFPAEPVMAEAPADRQLDDDLVGSWLDDGDEAVGGTSAAAESPEADTAGSSSSIEIGTGRSGIVAAGEADAWDDVGPAADAAASGDTFSFDDPAPAEAAAEEAAPFMADAGLEEAAGAAVGAVAAAAGAAARKPTKARKAAPARKGGLGQMVGVVLGGAMAIPITLAILIWGFQKDPFKVTKYVPENVAFLLPPKFQPGLKKSANTARGTGAETAATGSPLDALGIQTPPDGGGSSPEPGTRGGDDLPTVPMDQPGGEEAGEPVVDDTPVVPGDGETFEDPLAAATQPTPQPVHPEIAAAEAKRLAEEAAAADRKPLDAAVETALVAVAALEDVADAEDPARKKLLVELYKSLATVGAELVMLERISADAGRPLAAAPESLDGLHGRLAAHRDDLVRLGRNWLDFAKRPSDGVVLPVTFQSSRQVGPYWSSKVTLPQAKDGVRELTVLSRAEPSAVAGDDVVLTGMLVDGDVVWAADVREAAPGFGGGVGGVGSGSF